MKVKSSAAADAPNMPTPKPDDTPVPLVGGVAVTIGRIVRVVENANHVGPVKLAVRAGIIAAIPDPANPARVEVSVFRPHVVASVIAQFAEPVIDGGAMAFVLADDRAATWHWPPKG